MNNKRRVIPAQLKPFKKGADSRRNTNGSICAERANWSSQFSNALARKLSPDEVAQILVDAVRKGRPWAIELYLDRLIGKEVQPIDATVKGQVAFIMPRPNGNGEGKK